MSDENQIWNRYWCEKGSWLYYLKYTPTCLNILNLFKSLELPKDARILDAGCGTGKLASFWLNERYNVTGIDISEDALSISRKKGISAINADILKGLPFEDNLFDLVYSDGLLEHFMNPEVILKELFRVSGKFVLTLVPRIELYSTIAAAILNPPTEYKRQDNEWIEIHEAFNPKCITVKRIRFGTLAILNEVPNGK